MKITIKISHMCSFLQDRHYEAIEPETHFDPASAARIKELALVKLSRQSSTQNITYKEKPMKKLTFRIVLAAALVCAMSMTAFAAFGGLDFFRSIFGDSARIAEEHIQFPMASAADDTYRLTVESLLSDGFKTDLIISLSAMNGKLPAFDPINMFQTDLISADNNADTGMAGISYQEMPEFSQENKQYYHLEYTSQQSHASAKMKVSLQEASAPLSVTVPVGNAMARKEIHVNEEDYTGKSYCPQTIQLSPMGVLVVGSEKEVKGSLPTAQIFLQMKDGSQEELISANSFDSGDETLVMGGGSLVISDSEEDQPLVSQTAGSRNPDGLMIISGYFSRILNLDEVQSILVDGVTYPLQ